MKKTLRLFIALALLISLVGCGNTTSDHEVTKDVTWEELLKANEDDQIMAQVSNYCVTTTSPGEEDVYHEYYELVDGNLVYSYGFPGYSIDYVDGIEYDAAIDGYYNLITIAAPTADMASFASLGYGETLKELEAPKEIYKEGDFYLVNLVMEEPEFGYKADYTVYFSVETLLFDRIETALTIAGTKYSTLESFTYNLESFELESYKAITEAEDLVHLSIHYPDGSVKEVSVDRGVNVVAYYPEYIEEWSVCRDEACTESIFDLSWVDGDRADLYLCEGYVQLAAPELDYILENSTFEAVYTREYNTYSQEIYVEDADLNLVALVSIGWYEDETGPNLNYEVQDKEFEVLRSNRGRDGAWYTWTESDGYSVDFYHEFAYVNDLMDGYAEVIEVEENAEILYDEESTYYYIPKTIPTENGTTEIKYWISPNNYIDRIEENLVNKDGETYAYTTVYVGGNGPTVGSFDILEEVTNPSDGTETVELTVISSTGEKTYTVRNDAKISFEGQALFSDEACTNIVTDLTWVENGQASVYTNK